MINNIITIYGFSFASVLFFAFQLLFQAVTSMSTFQKRLYAMSSVVGNYNTNKQRAVVEVAINRKENVQTIEVKDFENIRTKEVKDFIHIRLPILKGMF